MEGEPKDLTTRVLVEIRDELRGHSRILTEHTRILTDHTRILTDHDVQLREHSARLARIESTTDQRLGSLESAVSRLAAGADQQSVTLRQILRAVEAGNERWDAGFAGLEQRVARLESHTGLAP